MKGKASYENHLIRTDLQEVNTVLLLTLSENVIINVIYYYNGKQVGFLEAQKVIILRANLR